MSYYPAKKCSKQQSEKKNDFLNNEPNKKTVNRNPIKRWFVTFPKSGFVSKDEFLLRFKEILDVDKYLVVEETHEDGSPHLHAIFYLTTGITKANFLKLLPSIYPDDYKRLDIEPEKNPQKAYTYLLKEELKPLTNFEKPVPVKKCKYRLIRKVLTPEDEVSDEIVYTYCYCPKKCQKQTLKLIKQGIITEEMINKEIKFFTNSFPTNQKVIDKFIEIQNLIKSTMTITNTIS